MWSTEGRVICDIFSDITGGNYWGRSSRDQQFCFSMGQGYTAVSIIDQTASFNGLLYLGRFNIMAATMMMSSMRSAPRVWRLVNESSKSVDTFSRWGIQSSVFAPMNQIILIFQGRSTTGNYLSAVVQRKRSRRMQPCHWINLLSLQLILPTCNIACRQENWCMGFYTRSTRPQPTGMQRS